MGLKIESEPKASEATSTSYITRFGCGTVRYFQLVLVIQNFTPPVFWGVLIGPENSFLEV